jgi:hypothetical protein
MSAIPRITRVTTTTTTTIGSLTTTKMKTSETCQKHGQGTFGQYCTDNVVGFVPQTEI